MPMMTFASLIETAEADARAAEHVADAARDASRNAPADAGLRAAAAVAASSAADAGRKVAALRFEDRLDRWVDRCARGDVLADELLMQLAPRHGGTVDAYWLAAAHLAQAGVAVPRNWRPPVSGEPVNDHPNPNQVEG